MREIPGDHQIKKPFWHYDHTVFIKASPADVWPWLIQMGNGRAGWYSHDWIDNLGKKSFEYLDPQLQNIKLGEKISVFEVADFETNQYLTLSLSSGCNMTWLLEPTDGGCNMITRLRVRGPKLLLSATLGPAHFIMQEKQNIEIKRRVEEFK